MFRRSSSWWYYIAVLLIGSLVLNEIFHLFEMEQSWTKVHEYDAEGEKLWIPSKVTVKKTTKPLPPPSQKNNVSRQEELVTLVQLAEEIVRLEEPTTEAAGNNSTYKNASSLSTLELELHLNQLLIQARLEKWIGDGAGTNTTTSKRHVVHPMVLQNALAVRTYRTTQVKTFGHFLSHIPKSGSSFAFQALNDYLWDHPQYKQLSPDDRFRPCNQATSATFAFKDKWRGHTRKHVCNLWMSEVPWTPIAQHNYIVLRNPRHHVLSQYFHCRESREHGSPEKRAKMPHDLTHWLEAWTRAIHNTTQRERNRKFFCYMPLNLQSTYVFPSKKYLPQDGQQTNITALQAYLYDTAPSSKDTQQESGNTFLGRIQASMRHDLKNRFVVVGDTSQMTLSVCLMFIRYTGWVPPQCDCSHINSALLDAIPPPNHQQRRMLRAFNMTTDSHGVQHHGATYPTTREEDTLIQKLTQIDQLVYQAGKEVLAEQVAEVEQEYNSQLCRK